MLLSLILVGQHEILVAHGNGVAKAFGYDRILEIRTTALTELIYRVLENFDIVPPQVGYFLRKA